MCLCSSGTLNDPMNFSYPIETLLPQSKAMVLLDRVVEVDNDHIVAELTVRDDGLFSLADQTVPSWVGLEYMAQTVAAFSGYHRKQRGEKIGLGFLLGTRYYQCSVDRFTCGTRLQIRAEKIIEAANDLSVFDCTLEGDNCQATSKLNVFLPQDSKQFLAGKGL
jgi:predicted hotdog family 3-hydroxylacyl-ACP dehydratase